MTSTSSPSAMPERLLEPGARSPEFMLDVTPDQALSLSDFRGQPNAEPKGAVARSYGAYRAKDGVAERALGVNPGADGILEALESMAPTSRAA